ncbi:nucleoside triphosphate pyrophosphohydrolase [Paenisporosarcina cavernae]|uniref:Phosphoribosyl-ATP pyrophosphohydrolase n=1 Tax=Paenisporosarcina cavernae TaxID=2320858 RepID=A0A385YSQ4_9BACL|nr:nucleoside triphosphate pyrophosphohydrolase [Paenisporosarcina cavernae]AYC28473.1 phosphoribosyl-ATP pyrophosphohydrolase [Paenisporosarcina cavernae]
MPTYNKLIRDRILEIIEANGATFTIEQLTPERHAEEIKKKLTEEVTEYQEAVAGKDAIEELADILELIYAALPIHGADYETLEKVRIAKKEKRGGFEKGHFLIEVSE